MRSGCPQFQTQNGAESGRYEGLRRNVRRALENGNLWTDRAEQVAERLMTLDERS
jgi:hypothetical protein